MNQPELTLFILTNSAKALVVGGICLIVALLAFLFSIVQGSRRSFASIGLFALGSGLMILAESQVRLLILDAPLLWNYIGAAGYYSLPIAMALLLEQWFLGKTKSCMRFIWQGHLVYLLLALGLSAAGLFNLSSTFPVFDVLLLLSLTTLFILLGRKLGSLSADNLSIVGAFALFSIFLVIDMLVAHNFLPWTRVPVSWGALAFAVVAIAISLRHYSHTQRTLREMNQILEQKVADRTQTLEAMAEKERLRSEILSYENEKSRLLSDLVSALERCINLNQGFQILAERLPEFTNPIAGSLYLRPPNDTVFKKYAAWRHNQVLDLPELPESLESLPVASTITTGATENRELEPNQVVFNGKAHWCFHLTLEHLHYGQVSTGAMLLTLPKTLADEIPHSSAATLFNAIAQATERISIVLSSLVLREQLQTLSYEDALTGLKNRRYFDELLAHELATASRLENPVAVIIADIDHFKAFNDHHGHQAGDEALKAVSQAFLKEFRETDTLARYGGEEFVVILPGASPEQAAERAETLRAKVQSLNLTYNGQPLDRLTLSLGVASWPQQTFRADHLLNRADEALYEAKHQGRNRLVVLPPGE